MFNINERPTGTQLEAFRLRCRYRGRVPTQQEFADRIGMPLSTYTQYARETRGKQMPNRDWTLLRITWDALLHAQWAQQHRPKHDEEQPQ